MLKWKSEPRGPGIAEHVFVEVGAERFELLAYTYDAGDRRLASSFEIYARDSRGRYFDQVAIGEAATLDEAKAIAEATVQRPRHEWPALKFG